MFLGRIISGSKLIDAPFYIEITQKYEENGMPTLIIGKKRAIDLFGKDKIHVLDRNIDEKTRWTYAKNERRAEYEEDLRSFIDSIAKKAVSSVNYYFINIFTEKYSFIKRFIRWMDSEKPKSVYVTSNHVYIYGGKDVIGLSLDDFNYAGIDSSKVLDRIASNSSNTVFRESDFMEENIRKFVMNNNIIVPYIHFLSR